MEVILEQLAPLLLLCLNAFLPVLLRYISTFEGHIAGSALEASLFRKMAAFQVSFTNAHTYFSRLHYDTSFISISSRVTLLHSSFGPCSNYVPHFAFPVKTIFLTFHFRLSKLSL